MSEITLDTHYRMVANLLADFRHRDPEARLIETHISSVLLSGDSAYKIKKPLDLGFLDFSTLAIRKHFCEEELRLNRRLAPSLYLGVVAITGTPEAPELDGEGTALEYLVHMRRFNDGDQLDRLLASQGLDSALMDDIADRVAAFHIDATPVGAGKNFGTPAQVWQPVAENFSQMRERISDEDLLESLDTLEDWSRRQYDQLHDRFADRRREGFIRECHGDMHLRNIALVDGEVVIFDGIEFSSDLRWIDVINDLAFLLMDLERRGLEGHAWRLRNRYLEITGDYRGLALLPFYQVYRALVRAKVKAIRLADSRLQGEERAETEQGLHRDIALAESFTRPSPRCLTITVGVSGSGKSTAALWLVEGFGAIRVRSDAERQRIFAQERKAGGDDVGQGIYRAGATAAVYDHLAVTARAILDSGYPVIVDATFIRRARRRQLADIARDREVPFVILNMECPRSVLEERIRARRQAGSDISEADIKVLDKQLGEAEAVTENEADAVIDGGCSDQEHRERVLAEFAATTR